MTLLCQIFRSPRRQETYLYVDKSTGLKDVPGALLESFGEPEEVMVLGLSNERKLARVDVEQVIAEIEEKGYFLQMPPSPAELFAATRPDD